MFSAVRVCINKKQITCKSWFGDIYLVFFGFFALISQLVVSHLIPLVVRSSATSESWNQH